MAILLIISGVVLIIIATSLRLVPFDPPHIAVVVFLGKRLRQVKEEGYHLFPFYPLLYDAILVNMVKRNVEFPPQVVRTSDYAEVEINVSVTWTPSRAFAIEFLDEGGDAGVNSNLQKMIEERLRQWALSGDWVTALSVRDEAAAALIASLLSKSEDPSSDLKSNLVQLFRSGGGEQDIQSLGITLNRLIVGQIKPKGDLALVAERMARETQFVRGVQVKADFVTETALKVTKALNCSPQQAIDLIQTESGTVARKINDMRISVSEETLSLVSQLIGRIRN